MGGPGPAVRPVAPACWSGHYTEAFCCDPLGEVFLQGEGNPDCWDSEHTYGRCCRPRPARRADSSGAAAGAREAAAPPGLAPAPGDAAAAWPPRSLLALLGTAGPLTTHAGVKLDGHGNIDIFSQRGASMWFPVHLPADREQRWLVVDRYSKGSACTLELATRRANSTALVTPEASDRPTERAATAGALASERWFAAGSNCRPYLHCPLWAPLAVAVMDRAASMSVLLWLAALDGRPRRRAGARFAFEPSRLARPSNWDLWESLAGAYDWGDVGRLERRWLWREYRAVGFSGRHFRNLSEWFFLSVNHIGMRGRRLHLPTHMCLTCCAIGGGRLRAVFVRSPFARLVSYFRMSWLGKSGKQHSQWEDFPAFVRLASDAIRAGRASLAFDDGDLLHTRPMADWLRDNADALAGGALPAFYVVHVEHVRREVPELVAAMCSERGFCSPLPEFPRINSFTSGVPSAVWAQCWADAGVAESVRQAFREDFEWFGYSSDPLADPPVRAGVGRLRFSG